MKAFHSFAWHIVLLAAATAVGCGGNSNLAEVTGVVKLDGQPLPNALVQFLPQQGGSPSAGKTDSSGEYSLRFSRDRSGAELGKHSVRITTYQPGDEDADPPKRKVSEKLPVKYNNQTELSAEVAGGSNTIDFDLQSGGPIIQPDLLEKLEDGRAGR